MLKGKQDSSRKVWRDQHWRFFLCMQCSSSGGSGCGSNRSSHISSNGGGSGITSNTIIISINAYIISIRKLLHKITLGKIRLT